MSNENILPNYRFQRIIDRPNESIVILSASTEGLVMGKRETLGVFKTRYPKAISVFTESLTLADIDDSSNITFGSTETEELILSTTDLFIKDESTVAVVSARGKDGEANATGAGSSRDKTHGGPGHKLRVFVGQAPSTALRVEYEAHGGKGATTIETDHAAGSGGDGGVVEVIHLSTWAPILQHLGKVIAMVRVKNGLSKSSVAQWYAEPAEPNVFIRIYDITVKTERLDEHGDPLKRMIIDDLSPLLNLDTKHTNRSVYEALKPIRRDAQRALDDHASMLSRSVNSSAGHGGTAGESAGRRGIGGKDGLEGRTVVKLVNNPTAVVGPLSFPPLHPLQCQMVLEMAYALLYIGDSASVERAKRILSRLSAKINAVVDIDEQTLHSVQEQQAREERIISLRKAYEDRRDLIGIPPEMRDPVSVLRRITQQASDLLFQCHQTAIDVYGYDNSWAPRLFVQEFEIEAKDSLRTLKNTESLYLSLVKQLDKAQGDESLWRSTVSQIDGGLRELVKEQEHRAKQIQDLQERILSESLKAELSRRADTLVSLLEELKRLSDANFEIGLESFLQSVGAVAKKANIDPLVTTKKQKKSKEKKPEAKKSEEKKPAETLPPVQTPSSRREENPSTAEPPSSGPTSSETSQNDPHPSEPSRTSSSEVYPNKPDNKNAKDPKSDDKSQDKDGKGEKLSFEQLKEVWEPLSGEITDKVWEGITTIPDAEGKSISKLLIAGRIRKALGSLADIAKTDEFRAVRDPKTGELLLDKERDDLLVATQSQIDKFVEDFLPSKIGPQAERVQAALKFYADLITERNKAKVEFNLKLKDYAKLHNEINTLRDAQDDLKRQYGRHDVGQLGQMTQVTENMYSWSRARTLRLLSLYSRAIYLATLEKQKGHIVGLSTNDASLSFPADSLSHVHDRSHYALFEAEEKSGSDASQFPPKFDEDAGKFVELASEDRQTLIEHKLIRLKLPPSTPDSIGETLPDFRGCADVRIYRVRFWFDGVSVRKDPNGQAKPVIVDINLTHEGDSIYYDPSGNSHVFSHAPIDVKPSFRMWPSDADGGSARPTAVDNGDIVSRVPRAGMVQKYAAPSPFATWTISLRNVDTNAVDLSKVTRAWFEFFGTSRSFRQTSS